MLLKPGTSIQVNIIDDKEMLRIGKLYKGKDYPTDVLTFNYSKTEGWKPGDLYGEIYVNIDAAKRQAKEQGHSVEEEVAFLVQHGMMHMQGIHHKGDE
ncbi:MAG TPA: rRNA maturation RNase YbeY [candidate division WWE3 bacterium]|uniref:rRNA maturation RNase YbeY n=1 Tax=candidate division WWE3 bacterium TaxID=2053526 RepID=A0A7V5IZW1_UNCKA|nr:rRNA maturation RNase YbeY [candidate division WWE3 bacterium]